MKNALRVLKRDLLRLVKAPAALVVVIVLIVLPSLYTWFNVVGFWNPYEHTGNLRVCVVNQDEGATTDITGSLDMGGQIVEKLEDDDQLGWVFTDEETALEEVRSGKAYAAFVIPPDFSRDVTTLLTGDFQQPQLKYYVNEKSGAVSPKITDAGATTLDETVNSTFVSTVSGVVAEKLDAGLKQGKDDIDTAKTSVSQQLAEAQASIGTARTALSDLRSAADGASTKANEAKASLGEAKTVVSDVSTQLKETSDLITATQNDLAPFIASLMGTLDKSSTLASQISSKTNTAIGNANSSIVASQGTVTSAITQGKATVAQNKITIEQLTSLANSLPAGDEKQLALDAVASLKAQNDSLEAAVNGLEATNADLVKASADIATASAKVDNALQVTLTSADEYRSTLASDTFPALNSGLTQLAGATNALSIAVANQLTLIDQTSEALDQLVTTLQATSNALAQTDELLGAFESDLATVQTDVEALGTSGVLADIFGKSLDPEKVADFMLSPTQLQREQLYPVNSYGSAMAPLFMNLTLWIGVFMLLVILRQSVDSEGIPDLTVGQRYLGKWLFLAPLAALQAVVCCVGNLVLGVQVASVPLFILTAVAASLTYLSIQYALSSLLQHIGKGLCIVLIFVQIPGATGLYPIEMTPAFFQAIYPLFPFTYGINALRETIGGFYGMHWATGVGMLLLFFVAFFFIGLKLSPYLTNLNRMFSKQIQQTGILNGEESELPARRYRLSHLFRSLADREEFRDELGGSVQRFLSWYPQAHRLFPFVAPAALVLATAVLSLVGIDKVIILTVWLVWLVLCLIAMVVVDFIRDNLEHELSLSNLTDEEIQQLFQARDGVSASPAPAPTRVGRGRHSR